jgi:hypothetical protein
MFSGKIRGISKSGAPPERCFTPVGSSHTHKHSTRLERLVRDKHFSLLYAFVSYKEKSFIKLAPVIIGLGNIVSEALSPSK